MRYATEVHSANKNTSKQNKGETKEPLSKLQDTKADQFFMTSRKILHQSERARLELAAHACNVSETTQVNDKKKQTMKKVKENSCYEEKERYNSKYFGVS